MLKTLFEPKKTVGTLFCRFFFFIAYIVYFFVCKKSLQKNSVAAVQKSTNVHIKSVTAPIHTEIENTAVLNCSRNVLQMFPTVLKNLAVTEAAQQGNPHELVMDPQPEEESGYSSARTVRRCEPTEMTRSFPPSKVKQIQGRP
jgi:hypothetical protein